MCTCELLYLFAFRLKASFFWTSVCMCKCELLYLFAFRLKASCIHDCHESKVNIVDRHMTAAHMQNNVTTNEMYVTLFF